MISFLLALLAAPLALQRHLLELMPVLSQYKYLWNTLTGNTTMAAWNWADLSLAGYSPISRCNGSQQIWHNPIYTYCIPTYTCTHIHTYLSGHFFTHLSHLDWLNVKESREKRLNNTITALFFLLSYSRSSILERTSILWDQTCGRF
jgi:hypothetical protein